MEKIIVTVLTAALILYALVWIAKLAVLGRRRKQTPKPGERWAFVDKQGPWPSKDYSPVVIVDVREGWVRYDMTMFKDQRMKVDLFTRMYRPVDA
jgi:hypothetical protein